MEDLTEVLAVFEELVKLYFKKKNNSFQRLKNWMSTNNIAQIKTMLGIF